jgi:hypothetical protein
LSINWLVCIRSSQLQSGNSNFLEGHHRQPRQPAGHPLQDISIYSSTKALLRSRWPPTKMARDIRQQALQKIAALSATSSVTAFDRSDLDRLCKATTSYGKGKETTNGSTKGHSLARVPMVYIYTLHLHRFLNNQCLNRHLDNT